MASASLAPPTRSLKGKVAIVTGAGSAGDGIGNGRAISILLAADGCNVICVDIRQDWANKTVQMIVEAQNAAQHTGSSNTVPWGEATVVEGDITDAETCRRIVEVAVSKYGRLDILVNNVGVAGAAGTAEHVDMQEWTHGLHVNISSMVLMSKYAIPAMKLGKPETTPGATDSDELRGSIVNMGSVAGLKGGNPHLLYPTTKGAVVNMTRAMAAHHAKDGIRVNCVCPGMLYTPMMYAGGMTEAAREARKERSLLGTEGTAWDCACAVVFLAGNHARWITGTILPVDAGVTAAVGIGLPKDASIKGTAGAKL